MTSLAPGLIAGLLLLGCFTGFAAGLLGIGGGMLLVPFLTMMFTAQGFSLQHVVHMAVATSLTTILFTSMSSVRAHHQRGAVRWDLVRRMGPSALIGTLVGASFAARLSTGWLALLFALFVGHSALQMLRTKRATAGVGPETARPPQTPSSAQLLCVGGLIGAVSSLVGAGGGFITVPYLSSRGIDMHKAVASSAAMGFPIALGGLLGYIGAGWNQTGLPPLALGYIYLPALVGVAATSVLFAPLGARTAHALNVGQLKRVFAILLLTLASYMLWKAARSFGLW
jgi:uncharacterized membrane protein YfcA